MTANEHRPRAAAILIVPLVVAVVLTLVLVVWAVLGLAATVFTRSAHGTLMKPVSSSA
jgi:predicted cobalt transporter CbtA